MKSPSSLSPSYPAAWLLFGLLFAQGLAHFIGASWVRGLTLLFFLSAAAWVAWLAWPKRARLWPLNVVDSLFLAFVSLVLVSLALGGEVTDGVRKFAPYLPFMMFVPYVCGRLMRLPDINVFMRMVLFAGAISLPLLLIDRLVSQGREGGRWAFFGLDHGALAVGALLAAALVALCVRILSFRGIGERDNQLKQFLLYGLLGFVAIFLVWVTARGWLLAGLVGVVVACLSAQHRTIRKRIGILAALLAIVWLSFEVLPKLDPYFGRFYAIPMDMGGLHVGSIQGKAGSIQGKAGPILGEASCKPFLEGVNSVAMRSVLYQEAIAMLLNRPFFGVGATKFGEQSCTGFAGFPHSTILQGLAELGMIGGGLLIALLAVAALTLLRHVLTVNEAVKWRMNVFVLSLFGTFLLADQIYGNYLMATGTWLLLGVAASMRANDWSGSESRG